MSKFGGVPVEQPTTSKFGGVPVEDAELVSGGSLSKVITGSSGDGSPNYLLGGADILASGVAGVAEEAVSGISGLLARSLGASPQAQENVQQLAGEAIPDYELGEDGQKLVEILAEKYAEYAPEMVKDFVKAYSELETKLGHNVQDFTGSAMLGAAASAIPTAIESAATLGGMAIGKRAAAPVMDVIGDIPEVQDLQEVAKGMFQYQSPAKQAIAKLLKEGSSDAETAGYDLVKAGDNVKGKTGLAKTLDIGGPKVRANPIANEAIRQGFDEGVIAAVKSGSKADNTAFKKMVNVMERGKRNKLYAQENRPSDVAGETLMNYVRQVQKANKDAGTKIDEVADTLRGQSVEFQPAITTFTDKLGKMGVTFSKNDNGDVVPNFNGSDVEGLSGPEAVIKRVVKRLDDMGSPDAYQLHQLKRYLSEQVSFGKSAEGLTGKTEKILKDLRHDIDAALDDKFPKYNEVNTQYSNTINALDALQDVAGQKMDLSAPDAPKAIGTLMRRVMGNAQSRVPLLRAMVDIEKTANKYGGKMGKQLLIEGPVPTGQKSNLLNQILFADELDDVFSPVARSSLRGELASNTKAAARAGTTKLGALDLTLDLGGRAYNKFRGVNPKDGFTAIKRLLKDLNTND